MKIIFLIPPSEWKSIMNLYKNEELSFLFEKPLFIAENASEKDLKCTWKKYFDAIKLNKNIENSDTIESIKRYNWVMYKAIDYNNFEDYSKNYFNDNFLILSGMYGLLKPMDKIWNYKLPIETKELSKYWKTKIVYELNKIDCDYIVDLLPDSYKKMINFKEINSNLIQVNFLKNNGKKISHWVKKIKWEWIKNICKNKWDFLFENLDKINNNFFIKNIYL